MATTPDTSRQHLRDSINTHLTALKSFGIHDVPAVPMPCPEIEEPSSAPQTTNMAVAAPKEISNTVSDLDLTNIQNLDSLEQTLTDCSRCGLCKDRKTIVFGQGNPNADLMFIGESPGAEDDEQDLPFAGVAGQLLTKIIVGMGLTRDQVYIANVIKCHPPQNKDPEAEEIASCLPFLEKQIELIQPKVIMCLGKFATQTMLNTQVSISRMRGQFKDLNGIAVMPSFHPAYLLRTPSAKRIMWEDCKKVMEKLNR